MVSRDEPRAVLCKALAAQQSRHSKCMQHSKQPGS
jgi:hypothetical protein